MKRRNTIGRLRIACRASGAKLLEAMFSEAVSICRLVQLMRCSFYGKLLVGEMEGEKVAD